MLTSVPSSPAPMAAIATARLIGTSSAIAIRKPTRSSVGVPVYSSDWPSISVLAQRNRRMSVASQKR